MEFDINVAMSWLLFIALFPVAFFWLRRVWRILVKHDYSEVALKRGRSPIDPQKYATYTAAVNLLAGVAVAVIIIGVVTAYFDFATWSEAAGITIWLKIITDFIVSRHAHRLTSDRKN